MKYLLTYQDSIATDLINNHSYDLAIQTTSLGAGGGAERDGDNKSMFSLFNNVKNAVVGVV
jgi:hypothetical protein